MKTIPLNDGWTFWRAEEGAGAPVSLPHDAMLGEPRAPGNPSGAGGAYFGGGTYAYERDLDVPAIDAGGRLVLRLEGVGHDGEVYVDGRLAARTRHPWATTDVDLTHTMTPGTTSRLRVVCHNEVQPACRWYAGAGLFRPVTLFALGRNRIELDGVRVRTLAIEPPTIEVATRHAGEGVPVVRVFDGDELIGVGAGDVARIRLFGARPWSAESPRLYRCVVTLTLRDEVLDERELAFGLRTLAWFEGGLVMNGESVLLRGGCVHSDSGILGAAAWREAEWQRARTLKENGFNAVRSAHNPCSRDFLDACDALGLYVIDETWDTWYRHKSAGDGADAFEARWEDDVRDMVAKDANHPCVIMYSVGNEVSEPADERGLELERRMVALCHELDATRPVTAGLNLMIIARAARGRQMYDEAGGLSAEGSQSGAAAAQAQGRSEDDEPAALDSTTFNMMAMRVGAGMNNAANDEASDAATSPALDALDVAGYNYASGRYPLEGARHPGRVIYGSETFPQDIVANWEMVERLPYLVGDFMWTAIDHLGEVGLGAWSDAPDATAFNKPYPWLLSGAGAIDLLGMPGGEALLARAVWEKPLTPAIAVRPPDVCEERLARSPWRGTDAIPSWAWGGCEGRAAHVEVYTAAPRVRLLLNGRACGEAEASGYRCAFDVPWEPGTLEAVALGVPGDGVREAGDGVRAGEPADDGVRAVGGGPAGGDAPADGGEELGRASLSSAEGPLSLRAAPRPPAAPARPGEARRLVFVDLQVVGANGVVESCHDVELSATVEGGELLALGSANPRTEESYLAGRFATYRGRALAAVLVGADGHAQLTVTSELGNVTVGVVA